MKPVNVFEMARLGETLSGNVPVSVLPRLVDSVMDPSVPLSYSAQGFQDAQGRPAMQLVLDADLPMRCDRCDQPLVVALRVDSTFYFVGSQSRLDQTPVDDTPDEPLLGSERFDLAELIEDEAILQLPLSPRHGDCQPATTVPGHAPAPEPEPERRHPFADLAGLRDQLRVQSDGGVSGPTAGAPPKPAGRAK